MTEFNLSENIKCPRSKGEGFIWENDVKEFIQRQINNIERLQMLNAYDDKLLNVLEQIRANIELDAGDKLI